MYAVRVRPARNEGFGQQHGPEVSPGFFRSINDEAVKSGVGPDRSKPRLAALLDALRVKIRVVVPTGRSSWPWAAV